VLIINATTNTDRTDQLVYSQWARFTFSVNQINISAQRLTLLEMLHFLNILPFDTSRPKDGLLSASQNKQVRNEIIISIPKFLTF
jgi:hypothetical protein